MGWIYKNKEVLTAPKGKVGFIYKITNLTNNKFYIGKKSFFSVTNPAISKKKYDELRAKGEPVTKTKNLRLSRRGKVVWRYKRKNKVTETNWKNYFGSNAPLLKDVASGHKVKREILTFCTSKKELTFRELEQIVKHDCLDICDCYNGNLLGKFFPFVKC